MERMSLDEVDARHSRPTMKDVAALSGVSIKTVSRVVNGEPGVSADVAERVLAATAKLDYRRDLSASSLRRGDGKSQTIGLLLEDVSNPFSSALHRAVEDVAREHGVVVFAGSVDEDPDRERDLAAALVARRTDGLIIVPTAPDQSYLARERRNGTPVVFVDRPPVQLDADHVVTDNVAGARDGTDHLVQHGHRRIAFLGDLSTISTARERYDGYVQALGRGGVPLAADLVRRDLRTAEQAQAAVEELLALPDPPTAVFASQNLVTVGALRALRGAALHRTVAVVGFDSLPMQDLLDPGVTIVEQDVRQLGALAAQMLFRRIAGDDSPVRRVVLPATLTERGTGEIPGPYAS
jgi:LacI family transcriptional regulator